MHHVHITDGIVLAKRPVGEADTLQFVLTRELGLVRASARSTRVLRSKLRYGLEPLTAARYSFVRGRREWRLVQVAEPTNLFSAAAPEARAAAGRVSQLLLRLVHGQEPHERLYQDVADGFAALLTHDASATEVVLVLRVVAHLGYLPHTEALAPFVDGQFSVELSAQALQQRGLLVRAINKSLQATGL